MWGNLYGWIIAGVLFMFMLLGLWGLQHMNRITEPTKFGLDPKNLSKLELGVKPSQVYAMTGSGDAGAAYRKAIDEVNADLKKYERFVESGKLADGKSLPAIKSVMEAASMSGMSLLMQKPDQNIGYYEFATPPDLNAIDLAGRATQQLGMLYFADNKKDEAKKHFEASFALGAKMFNERVRFQEAFKGIGLMNGSAPRLKELALAEKDEKRVADIDDFLAGTQEMTAQITKMWNVIYAVGGTDSSNKAVADNIGNVYHFTSPAMQERMWRVESTLRMGWFQYNVGGETYGRKADQVTAAYRLKELENDPDPAVAAAAKAGLNLTLQQFRAIK